MIKQGLSLNDRFKKNLPHRIEFIKNKIIPYIKYFHKECLLKFLRAIHREYYNQKSPSNEYNTISKYVTKIFLTLKKYKLNKIEIPKYTYLKEIINVGPLINKINSNDNCDNAVRKLTSIIVSAPKIHNEHRQHKFKRTQFKFLVKQLASIKKTKQLKKIILKIFDRHADLIDLNNYYQHLLKINNEKFTAQIIAKYISKFYSSNNSRLNAITTSHHYEDRILQKLPLELINTKKTFIEILFKKLPNKYNPSDIKPDAKLCLHTSSGSYSYSNKIIHVETIGLVGINACYDVGFNKIADFHGYKFLLHQMFDDKHVLSDDEFSKHKKFIESTLTSRNFLKKDSFPPLPKQVIGNKIPFLRALCNYFNPAERLVTTEMADDIKKIIKENIENIIDFENTTYMEETQLYKALQKIGLEKFCRKGRAEIKDRTERITLIQQNNHSLYSEQELVNHKFTIQIIPNNFVFSCNNLFYRMNFS